MQKTFPWLMVFLSPLLSASSVLAADIYRWTDENGVVHFGERPPDAGGERVELRQQPRSGTDSDTAAEDRRIRQQRLLDAYSHERNRKKQRQAEAEAVDARNQQQCDRLKRHWRSLSWGGPVYYGQDDGSRQYLSESERDAEKRSARQTYEKHCRGEIDH